MITLLCVRNAPNTRPLGFQIRTNSTKIGTDADYGTDNIPFTGTNTDKLCKEPPCTSNSWAAVSFLYPNIYTPTEPTQ